MVIAAKDRVERRIRDHIVHPAHVPLEVKTKPADRRRLCNKRPCGRFLRDHQRVRVLCEHSGVHLLQKRDGFQVLAAAVDIRQPFPVLAPIIEIEHRRDRIDADAVDMVAFNPEHRARGQKTDHLVASEIEDTRTPVRVLALVDILIFIEGLSVKLIKPVRVLGEMSGHPVHNHADTRLVAAVDKIHKVKRRAVSRGRSEIPRHLISPGAVVWIFHNRHQFDIVVSHIGQIDDQLIGRLTVIVCITVRVAPPGAKVQLVNIHGAAVWIMALPRPKPRLVMPLIALNIK